MPAALLESRAADSRGTLLSGPHFCPCGQLFAADARATL